ncbi:ABC transporter ATP-binding protein [Saliterribacillus persicus]|uniref:ATP-binding cassette subfamily B protein n=1 Tax=Saliterribacillus persicus TaxID=930114 RepID=A0A368X8E8_9BACI|nr:ABC transporter ATP-binding protein [Saliterribacillus persicus]RCW64241.1 ATP-binding cassette subfamily B protein [Saliterribacillus persicus]
MKSKQPVTARAQSPHHPPLKKKPKIKNLRGTVSRIWSYMATDKVLFWVVILLVFISSALSLLGPYLIGLSVDTLIGESNSFSLTTLLIILSLVFVFHSISLALQNYWMIDISQQTVFSMRKDLFEHVITLPMLYFQRKQSGDLMSRLTNDIENVSRTLNTAVIQVSTSILTLIGTIIVMLLLSPLLTLLTLTIVPVMYYGMKWITKRTGTYFKAQQKELGEMNGYLEETLSGHTMVKLFHQEERVIDKFAKNNEKLREVSYWAQVYSGFIPKLMNSLNNFSFAVIVGVGGLLAISANNVVSIGIIVTFTTYARQFTRPLNDLANQFNVILSAVAGAERVFEVLDEEKEDDNLLKDQKDHFTIRGNIRFDSVSFYYNEEEQVLNNVSFEAQQGQTVALVGPTGAGKTTIISLLARFYEPKSGKIWIDGKEIANIKRGDLRSQLGIVLQDAYLFDTTIRENIRYGHLNATDQQVEEAAKLANAHAFIKQLPDQYDTVLEGNGSGISQGQRQLISIARAMLSDPSILILDEATSSVDTITEIRINEALKRLMRDRTSFVIAHRLNTIEHADLILVLDEGEIIEQGTHTSLLLDDGFYANLVHTQQKSRAQ